MMKTIRFTFIYSFLFLCAATHNLSAQIKGMKRYVPPEGINMGLVTGIAQDTKGYMWFAGFRLYQFDGYHLKIYANDPSNPNSLGSNQLESICADKNGIIWIGTSGFGLDRLDPATGIFTHFRHDPHDPSSITQNKITVLTEDSDGFLWIGTHGGVDRLDTKTLKFKHFRNDDKDPNSLSCDQVRSIYEDRQGTLWIGTGSPFYNDDSGPNDGGLNRLDKKTGKFTRYMHDPKNAHSLIDNKVCGLLEDSHGTFWVGTAGDGLHTMDRSKGTFERHLYDPAHPDKLSRPPLPSPASYDHIRFISEDASGDIWIGTIQSGMNRYNPVSKKMTHFGIGNPTSQVFDYGEGVWTAFTSHEGVLWISTWNGSLYYYDPVQKDLPHTYLGFKCLRFFEQDSNIIWLAIDHGLIRTNRSTGISKRFINDTLNHSIPYLQYINTIYKDNQGIMWIGTEFGLARFNKNTDDFTLFFHDKKNTNSIVDAAINEITEDKKGSLWLASQGGVDIMDRQTYKFSHYQSDPEDTNSLSNKWTTSIHFDLFDNLWVGTFKGCGINLLNKQTGKFKHYLKGCTIYTLFEDVAGVIWVGTDEGLYLYDKAKDVFTLFVDPKRNIRVEMLEILKIFEDAHRNLWISTGLGLLKLNAERNDMSVHVSKHRMEDYKFTLNSSHDMGNMGLNGKLYFGTNTGYYSFFPDSVINNNKPPEIVLSDFKINEASIKPGTNSPLKADLDTAKEIVLNYNQNNFSFDFAGIHFTNPENNKHLFKLENYDNIWRQSGTEHTAYFYNVPPGHYIFRIKASSCNDVWAEKAITLTINPPWWLAWWAYTLYALLAAWGIYEFDRRQKQKVLRIERERTRERELAQSKEIEQAYIKLKATQNQLIQSEKLASLGELTAGIAHEIQNPLNFVNNFSELNIDLVKDIKDEMHKPEIDKVYVDDLLKDLTDNEKNINHHGKRAASIVSGMLEHSRASTGKKEFTDVNKLCDEYFRLSYHGLRAKNKDFNTEMITDFDTTIPKIEIIPQDVGRVILNLINNAFYAVNEKRIMDEGRGTTDDGKKYEPTVTVSTKKLDNAIEIRVKDNGTGMSEAVRSKVFQPFFTTKPTGQGTGLGLSLAYDIITKGHGGSLKVESEEGLGSEFVILFQEK